MKIDHHDSLDMPVFIWDKVHTTGDLSHLLIKKVKITAKIRSLLEKTWGNIYDLFIKEFGFNESFLEIKQKEIELAILQNRLIIEKDRILETWIDIAKEELRELQKANTKSNFMESKMAIESKFKFQINMQSTSVKEFYYYLKKVS